MRIVGGKFRGRAIASPKPGAMAIRPTTDRARESLFNVLAHKWADNLDDGRVLDLFCGTGALGFEALSRGARFALFVDMSPESRGLVRETTQALGVQGISKLFRRDATDLGPAGPIEPFNLVFADPPYGQRLGEGALTAMANGKWLAPDALIVLEEATDAPFTLPAGFIIVDERRTGDTLVRLIQQDGAGQ